MPHNEEYQALSRKLAEVEKRIDNENRAIGIMAGIISYLENRTDEQLFYASPLLLSYYNEVVELVGPDAFKDHPNIIELMKELADAAKFINTTFAEYERRKKLQRRAQARPVQAVIQEGRTCTRCNRKPARFDDLCGRCAEETGVRPKGKV